MDRIDFVAGIFRIVGEVLAWFARLERFRRGIFGFEAFLPMVLIFGGGPTFLGFSITRIASRKTTSDRFCGFGSATKGRIWNFPQSASVLTNGNASRSSFGNAARISFAYCLSADERVSHVAG